MNTKQPRRIYRGTALQYIEFVKFNNCKCYKANKAFSFHHSNWFVCDIYSKVRNNRRETFSTSQYSYYITPIVLHAHVLYMYYIIMLTKISCMYTLKSK